MEKQTVRQAMQQGMAQQNTTNQTGQQVVQQSVAHQKIPQDTVARKSSIQNRRREQQKREAKRRRNNIMKVLLCVALVFQVICIVELFLVLQSANKILDRMESGAAYSGTSQEVNASVDEQSDGSTKKGNEKQNVSKESTVQNSTGKNSTESADEKAEELPWNLVLVNKWNEMEEGYVPELAEYAEGHMVDARIEDALRDMIKGAKKAGYAIYLLSAYRDVEKQTELYEAEVAKWKAAGYTQKNAEKQAGTIVAVPGTSEHHLGLAVDLVSSEHVKLDEDAEKTKGYKWLVAHCHEYGFILRYPNGATDITGIIYEPWHFRYVGVEAATEIMEAGITLEEYLEQLK